MLDLFLIGLSIAAIAFAIVWAISVKAHNYGFLDVAWSYGVAVLAPIYALFSPSMGLRKWPLVLLGVAWSLRLGTYILLRVLRHHPHEDARYQTLRERWNGPGMFLLFFELQAVLVAIFSLPFLYLCFDSSPLIHPLTIAGAILAFLSIIGETLSDLQMQRFKAEPSNHGKICEAGLWRYSRHPNYFFESMVWWGFFLAALPSPHGWITVVCPLLMLYFLFQVTGIPLTEEYALKSKGDLYRAYQRTTSPFIPWFRKA
jgi:steroid 5-alpha reductase family enzyme